MNADILKGAWRELRGKVKEQWGSFTDDDLDRADGRFDQIVGLLQKRYGYARDRAEEELKRFVQRCEAEAGRASR